MNTNYKEKYLKYKKKYSHLKNKNIIPQNGGSSSITSPKLPTFTEQEKKHTGATIVNLSDNNVVLNVIRNKQPSMSPGRDYDEYDQGILTFQDTEFLNNLKDKFPHALYYPGERKTEAFYNVKFVDTGIDLLDRNILVAFNIQEVEVEGVGHKVYYHLKI